VARAPRGEVEFRYTSFEGEDVVTTLDRAPVEEVVRGLPVRRFGSHAGMGHYPGWWWSATMSAHVGYESLLERDRLMLADFDRGVTAVASQPFGLTGGDGDVIRRHVPDYLLVGPDLVTVVDVKPAGKLDKPDVSASLDWTGRLMAERGWRYEVWSGASDVLLTNVRFIAQGRRPALLHAPALAALATAGQPGRTLGQALEVANWDLATDLRAALLVLLWQQAWGVDLDTPLSATTTILDIVEVTMSGNVLELKVGARVWFDGGAWTVCEVLGAEVRLRDSHDRYRLTAIDELLGRARDLDVVPDTDATSPGMSNVALSALTAKQRGLVDRRLAVLAPLLQASSVDSEALGSAAAALGVSTRTVRRRLEDLRNLGPGGLIDERLLKDTRRSVDPRWDEACTQVLRDQTNRSTPSRATVIRQANAAFLAASRKVKCRRRQSPTSVWKNSTVGVTRLGRPSSDALSPSDPKGCWANFGRHVPASTFMDGYKLDVFAMEPVTMRWVNTELTVAMDLYDRSLKGIRLRPVAAKSADVADVLLQCLTPQQWGRTPSAQSGPYAGVPENVILGSVGVLPDTIVIDHGNVYMSEHTLGVCRRLGTSVQPAIPNNPTDKAALERFFARCGCLCWTSSRGTRVRTSRHVARTSSRGRSTTSPSLSSSSGNGSARSTTSSHTTGCATPDSPAWTCHRRRCSTVASPSRASCGFPPLRTCATSSWTSSGA